MTPDTLLVRLPRRMNSSGIDTFLAGMFGLDGHGRAGSFEIDFAALNFIEPGGVVVLANAIEAASARGCTVTFTNTTSYQPAISYLDDSGFFKLYTDHSLRSGAMVRGTTVPLQRVDHVQSHYWLESQFVSWLASRLSMVPEELASIHACMKKIFINIDNHSGTNIGCIYMQHFPKPAWTVLHPAQPVGTAA
jgi:hypothetical protein